MEESGSKTIKLPLFDGTKKAFQMWWTQFFMYATFYQFAKALKDEKDDDLPDKEDEELDESTAEGKKAVAARKRNHTAMAAFTMAFTKETTMGMVYKSMTKEWPGGLAHVVVKALFKKFKPENVMTRVQLRQALNKISMKANEDPCTLFEQISTIENWYNNETCKVDQDDLIATVIDAAPKEYSSVLTNEQ